MHIIIPDDYQNVIRSLPCFQLLKDHQVTIYNDTVKDISTMVARFKNADALVLTRERTAITEELVAQLPKLKLISQTGKISNHLDLAACTRHNIAVTEGIGSPVAPAELAWLLIMNAVRQVPQATEAMKAGQWQTNIGSTIHGRLIGIWGYGKIGKRMADYAIAFGAKVMVWGSENSRTQALQDGLLIAESKAAFFSKADVVTLHLRLTNSTRSIVTASDLGLMKPNAVLVNSSRAELIEEGALLHALRLGRPGFAAVDVYETEPIYDKDYPLLQLPNVICTPHLGYVEQHSYELYFRKAFENVTAFASGTPVNIANPEVLQI
ncbi:D-2-hydroxyacid dehydrogenase family protein [Pontibacter fetidus]|uniref:D-2-hydroxyacid dehydrogenase family protein n=1 Tax=Pontibacter fetidus TaxID=2700082 RepID=A0A6B2GXT0_9BACT|nr:D-2-hydroxyacid dehydrogenase family protein [Pontibacter fetidus]NDK55759.1 D-2-hydroxyacid dehydrogenase family protein [Pontibacter fetidus]